MTEPVKNHHPITLITSKTWLYYLLLLCSGGLTPLSLSPFDWWWMGTISVGIFAALITLPIKKTSHYLGKHFFISAWIFGLGYFGVGVSWVYVSIYYFGSTPLPLAVILTAIFVTFIALFFALPFYLLRFITPKLRLLIGIPLLWVFSEWIRTWILTGFPWLFIGYSHTDTILAGWAPIGGILLLSLFSVITSVVLTNFFIKRNKHAYIIGLCVTGLWLGGYGLTSIEWTRAINQDKIQVGVVQPNIPQDLRWHQEYQHIIKERLHSLSEPLWDKNDWIIWPEGALPHLYHRSLDFIDHTRQLAKQSNTTVISGTLYDRPNDLPNEPSADNPNQRPLYFNSIIGIGDSSGIYHKQRLVPFGEYVPLENWIRGLIDFFDLPFSVITSGKPNQTKMQIGAYTLANAICYEIAYSSLVAEQVDNTHVLLTVSNDAWFGDSIGPKQHFQMARMRAIEVGRYVIRGTNNGISAIIAPDGTVEKQAPSFVMTALEGEVIPMEGKTPFMMWKNTLVLSLLLILSLIGSRQCWRANRS